MSMWINVGWLIEFINSKFVVSWKNDYDGGFKDACIEILNAIEEAPSIEIVLCKECKHQHKCFRDTVIRTRNGVIHCPVEYCSYGERREK